MSKNRILTPFLLLSFVIIILALAIWGIYENFQDQDLNFFTVLYVSIQMFIMESGDPDSANWQIILARYLAAIFVGSGIFLLIYKHIKFYKNLWWRIKFSKTDYSIVFGLNQKAQLIAMELLTSNEKVVIIGKSDSGFSREALEDAGGIVFIPKALDIDFLKRLNLKKARRFIFVLDEDDRNIELAIQLIGYYSNNKRKDRKSILVQVEDIKKTTLLKDYLGMNLNADNIDLHIFNFNQVAARALYDKFPPHLNFTSQTPQGKEIHIAIIGFNQVTEYFILENIILSHYPDNQNINISLIHKEANSICSDLIFKYPFLDQFINLNPVSVSNIWFDTENSRDNNVFIENEFSLYYVFGDQDADVITNAKNIRQQLYTKYNNLSERKIIAVLPQSDRIVDLINIRHEQLKNSNGMDETMKEKFNVEFFRVYSDACEKSRLIDETELQEVLAKVLNYYYFIRWDFQDVLLKKFKIKVNDSFIEDLTNLIKDFQFSSNDPISELEELVLGYIVSQTKINSITDIESFKLQERWNMLTDSVKDSNRYAIRHIPVKIIAIDEYPIAEGKDEENMSLYEMEHIRWMAEKMVLQYIYGPEAKDKNDRKVVKNELKVHPLITPFKNLEKKEKEKDKDLFDLIPVLTKIKKIISSED